MSAERTTAERACLHIARRIQADGRLAYLIGPYTETYELVTTACAEALGQSVADFRKDIEANIRPVSIVEAA